MVRGTDTSTPSGEAMAKMWHDVFSAAADMAAGGEIPSRAGDADVPRAEHEPVDAESAGDRRPVRMARTFVHLRNARVFGPGPGPVEMELWRGRRDEIVGWSLGEMSGPGEQARPVTRRGGRVVADHPHIPFGNDAPTLEELEAASTPVWDVRIEESRREDLPSPVVAVFLDVSGRPDLTDLLRAIRTEAGAQTHANQWFIRADARPPRAFLSMRIERPVVCSFMVEFRADRHGTALKALADSGSLAIYLSHPDEGGDASRWFFGTVLSQGQRDYLADELVAFNLGE